MKKLLKLTIVGINIIFAVLLIFSYLTTLISPEYFWHIAYLGLIYPYLLAINVGFFIFWLIHFKKYLFISLVTILIGYNHMIRIVKLNPVSKNEYEPENSIRIMSYNVRLFDVYEWSGSKETRLKIFELISIHDPDIICMQEFMTDEKGNFNERQINKMLAEYKYHFKNYTIKSKHNIGLALYSKYPFTGKGFIQFPGSTNQAMYADVLIGPDTVRVYNTHLQSVGFAGDNFNLIDSFRFEYNERQIKGLQNIGERLRNAYILRANQANTLSNHIWACPFDKIICGDFNDTPVSYTYRKISRGLEDSFVDAGNGFGVTYKRGISAFRIDYILYSDVFKAIGHEKIKVNFSDHYPIIATLVRN